MQFHRFARTAVLLSAMATLSACAPMISGAMNASVDEDQLKVKTAEHFGVTPEKVSITSMNKSTLNTDYKAEYAGKRYNCNIYYGNVTCQFIENTQASNRAAQAGVSMSPLQAQTRLNQLGYSVGEPDGLLGKKTIQQLKLFQKSRGLPETGKLDSSTVDALRA